MTKRFYHTLRGVDLEIECSEFDGDPSVGIMYGPECVTAKTLDGVDFELTDEEVVDMSIIGSQMAYEDDE